MSNWRSRWRQSSSTRSPWYWRYRRGWRALFGSCWYHDILTVIGSANMLNIVHATFNALDQLKSPEVVALERGKDVRDVTPYWDRRKRG